MPLNVVVDKLELNEPLLKKFPEIDKIPEAGAVVVALGEILKLVLEAFAPKVVVAPRNSRLLNVDVPVSNPKIDWVVVPLKVVVAEL